MVQNPHAAFFFNERHFFRVAGQHFAGKPQSIDGDGFKEFP